MLQNGFFLLLCQKLRKTEQAQTGAGIRKPSSLARNPSPSPVRKEDTAAALAAQLLGCAATSWESRPHHSPAQRYAAPPPGKGRQLAVTAEGAGARSHEACPTPSHPAPGSGLRAARQRRSPVPVAPLPRGEHGWAAACGGARRRLRHLPSAQRPALHGPRRPTAGHAGRDSPPSRRSTDRELRAREAGRDLSRRPGGARAAPRAAQLPQHWGARPRPAACRLLVWNQKQRHMLPSRSPSAPRSPLTNGRQHGGLQANAKLHRGLVPPLLPMSALLTCPPFPSRQWERGAGTASLSGVEGAKMAAARKRSLGACQLGDGGSQRAVRSSAARPQFVEGSIVRVLMENFLWVSGGRFLLPGSGGRAAAIGRELHAASEVGGSLGRLRLPSPSQSCFNVGAGLGSWRLRQEGQTRSSGLARQGRARRCCSPPWCVELGVALG